MSEPAQGWRTPTRAVPPFTLVERPSADQLCQPYAMQNHQQTRLPAHNEAAGTEAGNAWARDRRRLAQAEARLRDTKVNPLTAVGHPHDGNWPSAPSPGPP